MLLTLMHDRRPTVAEQHQRPRTNHASLDLVPNQRQLSYRSHATANGDETNRTCYEELQSFVEMGSRNFVGEKTVRLRLELIHRDAQHATTAFMRAATGGFH